MDDLKRYLQQHKHEMDADSPSAKVLHEIIAQAQPVKKNITLRRWYRIAAAACIAAITLACWFWWQKQTIVPAQTVSKIQPAIITPSSVSTGILLQDTNAIVNTATNTAAKAAVPEADQADQLLESFSYNYNQLVNLQLKHIRNTPVYTESTAYFKDFKTILHQLDDNEMNIRLDIHLNGLDDQLLQQLIAVYQHKINLLKDLQEEINKINNKAIEFRQPGDTLITHYINI